MTTRDKRRARVQKRKNTQESENRSLYDESVIRHNERVIRQNMERDRQNAPMRYRREGHQQIPKGPKPKEEQQTMPYINTEGIEYNKRIIKETKARDRGQEVKPPEEMTAVETDQQRREKAFKRLVEYFKRTRV